MTTRRLVFTGCFLATRRRPPASSCKCDSCAGFARLNPAPIFFGQGQFIDLIEHAEEGRHPRKAWFAGLFVSAKAQGSNRVLGKGLGKSRQRPVTFRTFGKAAPSGYLPFNRSRRAITRFVTKRLRARRPCPVGEIGV